MVGFRKWIQRTLDTKGKEREKQQQQQQSTRDHLPFLPVQCPSVLTPRPPSQESAKPSPLPHNYGLFGRLPFELRRQILVEAFGGRTIHLDLFYGHPLVRSSQTSDLSPVKERRHCGIGSELVPDTTKPKGWQWFGCVCHRRAGYSESEHEQRFAVNKFSRTIEPCDDRCLEGLMCNCEQLGSACFVGVMGWLLTCGQAYVHLSLCFLLIKLENIFHFRVSIPLLTRYNIATLMESVYSTAPILSTSQAWTCCSTCHVSFLVTTLK